MGAFAIYRLPHDDHYTLVEQTAGEPLELTSLAELNGRSGFVLAPFAISDEHPLLLIQGNRVEHHRLESLPNLHHPSPITPLGRARPLAACYQRDARRTLATEGTQEPPSVSRTSNSRSEYHIEFSNFHAHLLSGDFRKIVLARSVDIAVDNSQLEYFLDACRRYPRMFICLVSTPRSGTWLTATPEILLSSDGGGQWQTMALAGTMQLEGDDLQGEGEHLMWSTKNIQEQRYVATYITECLEQFTNDFNEKGPYTARAGHLVHLRSDFTFSLPDDHHLGDLLMALHPTPAVCGIPKQQAFDFILQNEHTPRSYYSGFMGPLQLSPQHSTHLYVSLRCMQMFPGFCRLYAGGGLLPDSVEEQEWQETEAKLNTMRNLINDKSNKANRPNRPQ